jgi:sugar phosphate isomerase/epimerase
MSGSSSSKRRSLAVVAAAMDDDLRAAVQIARDLRFGAIQLDARLGDLDLTRLSQSGRCELRGVLRSSELDLVSLRLDLGAKGLGPGADIDAALDRTEELLTTAAGLQCSLVCVSLGPLPPPPRMEKLPTRISPQQAGAILIDIPLIAKPAPPATNLHDIPATLDPTFAAMVDGALAELGRRADRHGVTLALRTELAGFAALDRALRSAACPWFGIDLDPVAMLGDDWSTDEIFSNIGGMIRHVRARDAVLGADRRVKPMAIGRGSVDWPRLLGDLQAAGYHGWITVDPTDLPNRRAAATAGLATIRNIIR